VKFSDGRPELPHVAELEADYEFIAELSRGAAESVYHARERDLERDVVLKVAHSGAEAGAAVARLRREAVVLGSLQHPHITTLYGVRRVGADGFALAMQYVRGRTLRAELEAARALPIADVVRILTEVCEALQYAHGRGVVHGDITPDNIYLDGDSGAVRVSGWGAVPEAGAAVRRPGRGRSYSAPEQVDAGNPDKRSDLYSLGLVGCDMLTGLGPGAGSGGDAADAARAGSLEPLIQLRPDIPDGLRLALTGALHLDPAHRWADVSRFMGALSDPGDVRTRLAEARTVLWSQVGAAHRAGPAPTAARRRPLARDEADPEAEDRDHPPGWPRRRVAMIAGAAAVAIAGVLLVFALNPWSESNEFASLSLAPFGAPEPGGSAAEPALMYALFGDIQEGVAGDTLAEQIVLRVEDSSGQPVAGAVVRFTVREGESLVDPDTVVTDEYGLAGAWWIPGTAGQHEVVATVENLNSRTSFRAQARAPGRLRLSARSPTEVQVGPDSEEPVPVVVRVVTSGGEPVPNTRVRFAARDGAGRIAPDSAVTGADGTVRAEWRLGPEPAQELFATLADAPEVRLAFRASRTAESLAVRPGLALGGTHSCRLRPDGQAVCWGGNDSGQLGAAAGRGGAAVAVTAPEPLATLAAGVSHTCGVSVSGTAYCWGANSHGQLGNGGAAQQARPTPVATDHRLVTVAAGLAHSCALDADGRLLCWGQNANGQLGDGSNATRSAPVRAGGSRSYRAVAAGWAHTCGLDASGAAWCWGRNASGELGIGSTNDRPDAVPVHGGHRFTAIAAGSNHVCALRVDGAVLCWGQNNHGQLGTGDTEPRLVPEVVAGDARYTAIALGGVHSCALTRAGAALCWGRNTYGQLGAGSMQDSTVPAAVVGGLRFSRLHASGAHTCGTTADGQTHCWGYNADGQLGTGTRTNLSRPTAVSGR
jgi:hypothetical protein